MPRPGQELQFGPAQPPPPSLDEQRHRELLAVLARVVETQEAMTGAVAELVVREANVVVPPPDLSVLAPHYEGIQAAVRELPLHEPVAYPAPDVIAEAVAGRLPDHSAAVAEVLARLSEQIKRMDKRVAGLGIMPSGGSSDGATETTLRVLQARVDVLAEEATLAAILTAVDGLEGKDYATQATLADVYGALRPVEQVSAAANFAAGAAGSVSLPPVVGKTNYVSNCMVTSGAVAAVMSAIASLTGVVGGPLTYRFVEPVNAGGKLDLYFRPSLKAAAPNTAIVLDLPAIVGGAVTSLAIVGHRI